jgi:hypothetical protein
MLVFLIKLVFVPFYFVGVHSFHLWVFVVFIIDAGFVVFIVDVGVEFVDVLFGVGVDFHFVVSELMGIYFIIFI